MLLRLFLAVSLIFSVVFSPLDVHAQDAVVAEFSDLAAVQTAAVGPVRLQKVTSAQDWGDIEPVLQKNYCGIKTINSLERSFISWHLRSTPILSMWIVLYKDLPTAVIYSPMFRNGEVSLWGDILTCAEATQEEAGAYNVAARGVISYLRMFKEYALVSHDKMNELLGRDLIVSRNLDNFIDHKVEQIAAVPASDRVKMSSIVLYRGEVQQAFDERDPHIDRWTEAFKQQLFEQSKNKASVWSSYLACFGETKLWITTAVIVGGLTATLLYVILPMLRYDFYNLHRVDR